MEAMTAPAALYTTSQLLAIVEQSQIGGARRAAVVLGNSHGLDADAVGRLAIVVTEAATNLLRHATRGQIVLRAFGSDVPGVEMLAIDKGPGIIDVQRAMRDGFSTYGSAGEGLGGMKRLSDTFGIYSQRNQGTVVLARIVDGARVAEEKRVGTLDDRVGAICVPFRGEVESGDAWRVVQGRRCLSVLVVDGLGHGSHAAAVSATALAAFGPIAEAEPDIAVAALDKATRGSRGAALSVAVIDPSARQLRFCGVGNVDGRVLNGDSASHLVPQNGIVGHALPTLRATVTEWPARARLVMHSDGVSARWRADSYPGLASSHPSLLAGVLFRDFARERDDVTILVVDDREPARGAA
jgi:anti-sigma regulatory factor (Ser/Thr protein kinase)